MIYVDTSALVPYYCPEPLSEKVQRVLSGHDAPAISDLVEVEFFSALAKKVRVRQMRRQEARDIQAVFLGHLAEGLYIRLPLERRHFAVARTGSLRRLRCWSRWMPCT